MGRCTPRRGGPWSPMPQFVIPDIGSCANLVGVTHVLAEAYTDARPGTTSQSRRSERVEAECLARSDAGRVHGIPDAARGTHHRCCRVRPPAPDPAGPAAALRNGTGPLSR